MSMGKIVSLVNAEIITERNARNAAVGDLVVQAHGLAGEIADLRARVDAITMEINRHLNELRRKL
jgi:hypothetical protein